MKIICAPDNFKGSLSASEAAAAMQRGIVQALPDAQIDTSIPTPDCGWNDEAYGVPAVVFKSDSIRGPTVQRDIYLEAPV